MPGPIAPLIAPHVDKLSRLGTYHAWAFQMRSTMILSDPDLWAVTVGLRPQCHGDYLAMENLHLRACAWIYLHLPDDVLSTFAKKKDLDGDANAVWKELRRSFGPEECQEGNERCTICSTQKFAFVDAPIV